jgi:hypothetical protein
MLWHPWQRFSTMLLPFGRLLRVRVALRTALAQPTPPETMMRTNLRDIE